MPLPELKIENGLYYRPYIPPEYPEIPEDYLPDNVQLHFEFGPHVHRNHGIAASKRLRDSDIYIPEAGGYTPKLLAYYDSLVNEEELQAKDLAASNDPFGDQIRDILIGSKKVVLIADIDKEEFLALAQAPTTEMPLSIPELAINSYNRAFNAVTHIKYRNAQILSKAGRLITKAVSDNPELQKKPNVKVLATMGSAHADIYTRLAHLAGVSASEWRHNKPTFPNQIHRTVREKIASNQPVTEHELVKRGLSYDSGVFQTINIIDNAQYIHQEEIFLRACLANMSHGPAALLRWIEGRDTREDQEYFSQAMEHYKRLA